MTIRVATFNVENLFARYRFRDNADPLAADGFTINDVAFDVYNEEAKRITARAIREIDADILCLQEVENMAVLERFNSQMLGGRNYRHRVLVDSHDPRFIDVAILSRFPVLYINTHRHERNASNTAWLFSRDCLEVDLDVSGTELSLYVNHFKSMIPTRTSTRARRQAQADRVSEIVDEWWSDADFAGNFIVVGDFNNFPQGASSLGSLLSGNRVVNVVNRLPQAERWTHFWAGGNEYRQLDYILLSRGLADANAGTPQMLRKGLPHRATRYTGERYPGVGDDRPKASDHAPLYMDIDLI